MGRIPRQRWLNFTRSRNTKNQSERRKHHSSRIRPAKLAASLDLPLSSSLCGFWPRRLVLLKLTTASLACTSFFHLFLCCFTIFTVWQPRIAPVRAISLTLKSLASNNRKSAGTTSPVPKTTLVVGEVRSIHPNDVSLFVQRGKYPIWKDGRTTQFLCTCIQPLVALPCLP